MTFVGLALCLTLLGYGAAMVVGSGLVLPFLGAALKTTDPSSRSRRLFALRLLPAALGAFAALGLVLPAFLWLEPRNTTENVGSGLVLLALLTGAVLMAGLARGSLGLWATRRLVRRWAREARPIRLPGATIPTFSVEERFPLVAVVGCRRPRLFVSSTVVERCTSAELAAIVAHESGHVRRKDPWKRVVLRACPDVLALTPVGAEIERHWAEAAEQAADDHASALGTAQSLDLASALIRVARLAGSAKPSGLPLTALYRGGGVASRVSRLLERSVRPFHAPGHRFHAVGAMMLAAGALFVPAAAVLGVLHQVHRVLESVVHLFS